MGKTWERGAGKKGAAAAFGHSQAAAEEVDPRWKERRHSLVKRNAPDETWTTTTYSNANKEEELAWKDQRRSWKKVE